MSACFPGGIVSDVLSLDTDEPISADGGDASEGTKEPGSSTVGFER